MDLQSVSARAISVEIGERLKNARLNADYTQKELAVKSGLSIKAVTNSEKGKSTLESVIAILIALELTSQLEFFIPKQTISPIQLAKLAGKKRQRATGSKKAITKNKGEDLW